jgi:CRP-like cAMP-binding protein
MHEAPRPPTKNHILAALPPEDYERLAPHLEPVKLSLNQILYESGGGMEYVYFPTNVMISLVSQMADGGSVEVGLVGFEGMLGLPLVLGVEKSPHQAIIQISDGALRAKAEVIKREFKRGGALSDLLLRFTQAMLLQISQVAACNRVHTVEERLARWLLMTHDRAGTDRLELTQEFLAVMLGCRRAGVTSAAITLQGVGAIRYSRGHIIVLDRPCLEDYACECYQVIKAEFDRVTA